MLKAKSVVERYKPHEKLRKRETKFLLLTCNVHTATFNDVFCYSCALPVIGTNRTGIVDRRAMPSLPLLSTIRSWSGLPTGQTSSPPSLSWSISGCGIFLGAAVTMIRSNGAFSDQPAYPSPMRKRMFSYPSLSPYR